jgi:hypothetical protein
MKKLLVILMAMGMFSAMPVLAAEHAGMDMSSHEGMKMDTPDGMRECALQAESIQQKVKRLQGEIQKGSKKYSAEDIKKLELKLKEANDLLDSLNKPGR